MGNLLMSNVLNYQAYLETVFKGFLLKEKISEKTRKNYVSDIRRFTTWIFQAYIDHQSLSPIPSNTARQLTTSIVGSVSPSTIEAYKGYLRRTNTPDSTVNRHLSSIRMFFRCAVDNKWTVSNPSDETKNIPQEAQQETPKNVLSEFQAFLIQDGASKTTVNTYRTDVEEFLKWLDPAVDL